jgi:hypothetical protein
MKKYFLVLPVLFFFLLVLSAQQEYAQNPKFALVIGNGAYTDIGRLNNPVNDAADMKAALEGLDFQVNLITNGTLAQMEDAVVRLGRNLSGENKAYGLFYYAGHGVQSQGENYLIPVDAQIRSESFLRTRALVMQAVLDEMQSAGNELNMIILDACRDNPFNWARGGSRGLSMVSRQPPGSIIVYATSVGSTAADGTGRNGLFTGQLLTHLKTPGLEVKEIFNRTGASVRQASNNTQIPAIYSQFFETAYLGGIPSGNAPQSNVAVPPNTAPAASSSGPPQNPAPVSDASFWIKGTTLVRYPGSAEHVEIPNGITTIGGRAFSMSQIKSVQISQSVTTIGLFAFWGSQLSSVVIPSGVTTIMGGAFYETPLRSVSISASVTTIGVDAFYGTQLSSVDIPESVTTIGRGAFAIPSLKSITVNPRNSSFTSVNGVLYDKDMKTLHTYPGGKEDAHYAVRPGVTGIEGSAFRGVKLQTVYIPASVTYIGSSPFYGSAIKSIMVDLNNSDYTAVDGVLFSKSRGILKSYPPGRTDAHYVIPTGVRIIDWEAFSHAQLRSVLIPPTVDNILSYAFYNSQLRQVSIPAGVVAISERSFSNCKNLTTVELSRRTSIGDNAFEGSPLVQLRYRD